MHLGYYLVPYTHHYFYPYKRMVVNRCPYNGEQASLLTLMAMWLMTMLVTAYKTSRTITDLHGIQTLRRE
jgi:hypothetical protein